MLKRTLNLNNLLDKKSFFLFGQRGVGKTSLIRQQLGDTVFVYDLLKASTFERLSRRPELLGEEAPDGQIIVIDEVQKLPQLLDEVHRLIEGKQRRFLLTGSSARKLRRGSANLLAGRAWEARLFPLVSSEIIDFDLMRYLCVGGLPAVYLSPDPWEELKAYTGTYLKEEIIAESAVRKFDSFVSFLDAIAPKVGEEINMNSVASDCGVSPKSIAAFLQLLDDTLIGFQIPVFRKTIRRKATSRSKFYFTDIGIANSLVGRKEVPVATESFGRCFEHFIALELRAYLSYRRRDEQLTFWRTHTGYEVDFIVGNTLAIEVKTTEMVNERHLKSLKALKEEGLVKRYIIVSRDPYYRKINDIEVFPWQSFLHALWNDQLIGPF